MTESFIPALYEEERVRARGHDVVEEYRNALNEKMGWTGPLPYEDLSRWKHDPEWHTRLVSIQSAHDGLKMKGDGHWFWMIISAIFLWSQVRWIVRGIL